MTQAQQADALLVADETGTVYQIPMADLAGYKLTDEQIAADAAAHRAADDEVQGYWQSGYTVRPGDSLWAIAQRTYGDGRYWVYLYAANADQIRNPNLIYAGQTLRML